MEVQEHIAGKEEELKGQTKAVPGDEDTGSSENEETGSTMNEEASSISNSEETDTEDEESEEEEDDDDDEEPKLKYNRITGSLPPTLFNSDSISTCLISETFYAFATHAGFVHITDTNLAPIRTLRAHSASVLALSTDGHYLASASLDGTIVIGSIQDAKDITKASFGRPVHAVALDPNYRSSRAFISGGMDCKLIYSEKGWLGRRNDTIVAEYTDSAIVSAHWIGGIWIWMTDEGISIYSKSSMSEVHRIPTPEGVQRADMFKPRICSPENNQIYIAWVNTIWVLRISTNKYSNGNKVPKLISSASSVMSAPAEPSIEVELTRKVDFMIGGIASFHGNNVLLIGCANVGWPGTASSTSAAPPPPELKVYDLDAGEEVYADELSLKLYQEYGVNDYHLGMHHSLHKYFIVSAKDAVLATERDLNDHISWLVDHERYQEAWEMSEQLTNILQRKDIGIKWVQQLVNQHHDWCGAGAALDRVLKPVDPDTFKEEWERWGWMFVHAGEVKNLVEWLPSSGEDGIDKSLYDAVLVYLLENDRPRLLEYLKKWTPEIFNVELLRTQISDTLGDINLEDDEGNTHRDQHGKHSENDDAKNLRRALVELLVSSGDPASAVDHLIHLQDKRVIELVSSFHLLHSLRYDQIAQIMTVGVDEGELEIAPVQIIRDRTHDGIKLIVDGRHQVLPATVVSKVLTGKPQVVAFLYLEQLNDIDPFLCKGFGDLQVKLYAEFDRPKLLSFMKKNSNYNLNMALEVCESNDYVPELVYLLGKVGQNKRALELSIHKLQDPEQAIEFANAQNDKELWNDLIQYSMDKPQFIKMLLLQPRGSSGGRTSASAVDPVTIIKMMSENMEIPELKHILMNIFTEKEVSLSISQGVLDIVNGESQQYSDQLRRVRNQGDLVDFEQLDAGAVDIDQAVVITPQGDIKNEVDILGDADLVWRQRPNAPGWSVRDKIRHLAYILKFL